MNVIDGRFGISRAYQALGRLLEYPQNKESLLHCLSTVSLHLEGAALASTTGSFGEFLNDRSLPELQEDFVATFDFNPARAPYLGHHLYGDNHKKAAYMIMLKQEYQRHGFLPQRNELPDHLSVVLGFLAHLGLQDQEDFRREFIAGSVLPGVQRLTASAHRDPSPWLALIETAQLLLSDDCKEVPS